MFGSYVSQPRSWKYSFSISFITEPLRKNELPTIDVVVRYAVSPTGFCVDAGAADARVSIDVLKIAAQLQDCWMGEPDISDTVFSEAPVHELADHLSSPTDCNPPSQVYRTWY